jgi:hypothetical protein
LSAVCFLVPPLKKRRKIKLIQRLDSIFLLAIY